jgi:hypothetical protein
MEWRDELAAKSVRHADYAWTVLARILSVALKRGKIDANPCVGGEMRRHFLRSAPAHSHLPLLLALWNGQRQGDLLRLSWSTSVIRLRPSKVISRKRPRGKTVIIPVGVLQQDGQPIVSPLKAALDARCRRHGQKRALSFCQSRLSQRASRPQGDQCMSNPIWDQAVIIGAGMGGLAAAPSRPGTPQARHTHLLHAGGYRALEYMFPGLERDLIAAGAVRIRFRRDIRFEVAGFGARPQRDFGFESLALSRPALERLPSPGRK